jgi:Uma2 family endonuclease
MAPVDVFLEACGIDDTVVQPDVFVVCDPSKVTDEGIQEAPDFVAEVLSESTAYKDLGHKKKIDQRAGVREYWIIHPGSGAVSVLVREGTGFAPAREYSPGQEIPSAALPGFAWRFPS